MSLLLEKYDNAIDYCWYDSSTIKYSKCYDKKDDYKDLEVTFKDGRTYKYFKVTIQDYLLFKHGGLSNSQGKALNSFIKKYKFEKLDSLDINTIEEEKKKLLEEKELEKLNNKKEDE